MDDTASSLLIGLGANLARRSAAGASRSPAATLDDALEEMAAHGIAIERVSAIYETPPVGGPAEQPPYANRVVAGRFAGSPQEALALLMTIERRFGRRRDAGTRHGPRTLDLDLLDHDGRILPDPGTWERAAATDLPVAPLVLPHPRMHRRAFVLVPLVEIRPDWRHPVLGSDARTLLDALSPDARAAIRPWPAASRFTRTRGDVGGPVRSDG